MLRLKHIVVTGLVIDGSSMLTLLVCVAALSAIEPLNLSESVLRIVVAYIGYCIGVGRLAVLGLCILAAVFHREEPPPCPPPTHAFL